MKELLEALRSAFRLRRTPQPSPRIRRSVVVDVEGSNAPAAMRPFQFPEISRPVERHVHIPSPEVWYTVEAGDAELEALLREYMGTERPGIKK